MTDQSNSLIKVQFQWTKEFLLGLLTVWVKGLSQRGVKSHCITQSHQNDGDNPQSGILGTLWTTCRQLDRPERPFSQQMGWSESPLLAAVFCIHNLGWTHLTPASFSSPGVCLFAEAHEPGPSCLECFTCCYATPCSRCSSESGCCLSTNPYFSLTLIYTSFFFWAAHFTWKLRELLM